MTRPRLRSGPIGTGFMGRTHDLGFSSAPRVFAWVFDLPLNTLAAR